MDYSSIFVSFRNRAGASDMARLISDKLRGMGFGVFLDMESIRSGTLGTRERAMIEKCGNAIFVLTAGDLDGCRNEDDRLGQEIRQAMRYQKNIIIVTMPGFRWPEQMPGDLTRLHLCPQVAVTSGMAQDVALTSIMSLLKGKAPGPGFFSIGRARQQHDSVTVGGTSGLFGRFLRRKQTSEEAVSYFPDYSKTRISGLNSSFGKGRRDVFSSVFAPSEVRHRSNMLVQIYLHLPEESDKVKAQATESDPAAIRRDYVPLQVKLKSGDKVNVDFSIYGESILAESRKSIIWRGSCVHCSFNYFVPGNLLENELYCETTLSVNGALAGEMHFITRITEHPKRLNTEVTAKTFKRIFISYSHEDINLVKNLAVAYRAQGTDYFFDREKLLAGDVYEEKIFGYIDSADLFILCWSRNAARSQYVAREKKYALKHAYPQLSHEDATLRIYPVSIEPRAELPADMKDIYNFEVI